MTDSPATGTVTFTADADGKYTIDSALTFVGAQLFETGTDQYLTLTIGAAGSIAGSVTVEEAYNIYVDLVNDGSITADLPGQTLAIEPFKFANAGSITAEDAATLLIAPALTDIYSPATNQYQEIIQPWSNSGTITGVEATLQLDGPFTNSGTITATGGELDLGNSQYYDVTESWRNAGTISTSLTAVVIYGAVTTAGFGNFTRDGGSIRLSGTIDNSGAVIDLSQGLFEGLAIDGTITGGTLVSGPDGEISGSSGTLDNVTVVGGLALGTGGSLTFEGLDIIALPGSPTGLGALTAVGGTLTLYGNSELTTDAGVTALPSGETTVVAASEVDLYGGQLDLRAPYSPGVGTTPSTLTIGQGMVVAGVGEIGVLYGSTGLTLENRGTIESGLPGGLLTIEPVTLVNDGDLVAENGATLVIGTSYPTSTPGVITLAADGTVSAKTGGTIELSGTFSNAGTITATDATLDLGGGTKVWSNTGTITATDSTVEISGDVTTAAVATIERSGGTIELVGGTLDNSGATINTNSGAFRGLVLDGGTISGGTLITGPGGILATADDGTVTLSGVTVVGGLDLTSADGLYGGFVTLTGGTEIEDALGDPAPIVVNYATYIDLQSFGVLNSDVTLNNSEIYDRGGAFTIAAGVTVSGSGGIYGQSPTSSMINLGTIDVTGGDLTIANFGGFSSGGAATKPIVNDGTIDIAAGATLSLDQSIAAGSGPGAIDIGAGATLDLEGVIPASADQTITFTGAGGQLVLGASYEAANGTGLGATISGFGIGDAIEIFSTAAATSISYVGGTLTLGGGLSDTFTLSGDYTDDSFALTTTAPTYTGEETATIVTVSPKPPTADAWNDGSGDWQSSGAWSTGTPTGGTDAVIGASGSYTVTVAAGETEAVDNLTLDAANATLQIATGGTLDVAGTLKVEAGTLAIAGTIAGGSLAVPGGSIDFDNGTLADATLASAVTIAGTANLLDDTFTAPVTAGASSIVNLEASGTVSFSGTVTLAFGTLTATDIAGASPTTLRLNSDARVTGSGSIGAEDFSAAVPEPVELDNFGTISGPDLTIDAAKFFNFGSLSTSASGYLAVATDNWTNSPDATISETDGSLYLDGSWINDGSITADGGSLVLGSPTAYSPPGSGSQTQWFNENGGTITATGAAITLYGDESLADIEGIQRSGGSITLGGTLDATGQTVNLTSGVLAGLELADGTILGGTIVTGASTSPLIGTFGTSAYGTLAGDTVEGALIVIGGPLTLTDGTGIVNTDTIGSGAGVVTLAGGSLDDVTADLDDSVEMVGYTYSNTLTLTNLTATTASGAVVTQPSDIDLGIVVEGGGTITGGRVINYGTIDANGVDSANSAVTLAISSAGFTNSGALVAEHGDTLEVEYQQSPGETGAVVTALATGSPPSGAEKPWINTAGGTITGVLSTIKLGGDFTNFGTITTVGGSLYLGDGGSQWTNLGTITTTDTAVYLGGDVPLDLGDINETGGELYLTGTLDNTGNTIDTNSAPYDNLVLAGGTIVGGTLITGPDGALNTGSTSGYYESTLDGVTVEGGLLLGSGPEDFGALALIDGTRILAADGVSPGTITVDGTTLELRGYTTLANDITLTGYGDLRFTQTAPNNSFSPVSSPLPTIEVAAGVLVDGGGTIGDGGGGYGSQGQYTLVNDGTIDADISGDTLTIETENFTNDGTVAAQYGGNLNIVPEISYSSSGEVVGTFTNLSGDTLTGDTLSGGTYSVDAQSTLYIEYAGAVVFDDATITLSGDNYTGYYGNNGYSPHFFSESPSPYGTTLTPLENTLLTVSPDGALNLVDGYSFVSTNTSGYSFSIAGSVTLGGGLFSVNGLNTGASGTLSGFGSVTAGEFSIGNSGLIEANGGTLELLSPTFAGFAGAGSLAIGSTGAVLDLTGADDENVLFNGLVGELEIARPTSFSGAITGVAPGDMIAITSPGAELTDPHLSPGSTSTSGTLEVSDGQNTYSFAISGDLGTGNFIVTGTDTIVLSPSVTATEPAQGRLNSPTTINLGHVHVGESGDQFLSLTNIASPGAQGLDVSIGSVTGGVTASGGIVDLEPDHTSDNAIAIGLGGGTAGTEDDTVTLVLSSDPGDGSPPTVLTTIPVTVEGVVDNRAAVSLTRLPSANSPPGDFTQTGPYAYEYKVDLAADSPPPEIDFGLTNTALAPGDSLFGNFSIVEDAAATAGDTFINHFVNFGEPGLAPGAADDSLSLTINTQNTGAYSETITFDPTAYDPDYQGSLPPVTLTIDVFLPPSPLTQSDAEATVSPNPVLFSPLHELKGGEYPSAPQTAQVSPLTIGNTADPGSAKLTGSVTNSTGPAQGIGAVGPLDPGGTDTGGIKVQVPNAALQDAGGTTFNGAVTVGFQSNYDFGTVSPLPSQTVNYSGAIYAYADPELASPYGSSTLQSSAIADLGQFTPSDAPVDVDFDIYNDAPYPYADYLTGTWDFNSPPGFSPIFLSPVTSPLAGDGAAPDVAEIEFDPSGLSPGTYTAVLTFEPYNQSPINGFSGALPDVTLELEAQIGPTPSPPPKPPTPPTPPQPPAPPGPPPIPSPPPPPPPGPVAPPPPTGHTGGDVHLTTFAGGYYTLQAAGEFVLAQSTVAGDSFEIEGRFEPPAGNSFVTYTTAIAAEIGSDDVTFDAFRSDTVWINHSPVALGGPNSVMTLSGGTLTELSPTIFELAWNTGETLTVDIVPNSEIETSLSLPLDALPGSVKGLLGGFDGRANDFALPNGTVLTQPLSPSTLYSQFANAWRVSPSTTLFDYSAGEDTKDFTNLDFPLLNIPLSDFPTALVQRALEMATAAGITDPNLIDAAAYDYLVSGSPAAFTAIAELGIGSPTVASPFSRTAATATLIGVFAAATSVREAGSGATTVTFEVYLAQQASQAITVDYAVVDTAPGDLSATALGGTLPSGTVTIAQGSKTATFSVTVPEGALGGMPSGTLAIQIASDPSNSNAVVIGANAQTQIVSGTPVAGPPAIAEFGIVSGQYTLAQSGNNYTLNFGTLVAGELVSFHLAIENLAAALADDLTGAISATGTGFALANTKLPSPIAPGASYQSLVITPDTSANGNFTETITFAARDVNDTGFAANLSPLVLTITDAVAGQAAGRVNTASPIAFGNVHLGTTVTQAISVTNTASPPAAGLDATAAGSGDASTAGRVSGLAPGATDATDLVVQLGTNAAGPQSGAVTVDFSSDSGDGNVTSLPASPAIAVTATVYREAVAAVSPISDAIVHVHGSGDIALAVGNATASDGYSEDLLASVIGVAGAVAAGGTTGDIAPGGSSNAIEVSVATDTAGLVTGTVTLGLASDGGTGAGSIDGLGTTALSPRTVGVSVVVNNYADPLFESPADAGTLTRNGNDFTLDLGEIARGSGPLTIDFGVLNAVTGPADLLSGGFTASGAAEFTTAGLAAFSGVAAGQADAAPSVTLDTGAAGTYSETITLTATGSNASGYSGALSPETLTITGQVAELPPPVITVPTAISAFTDVTLTLAPVSIADSDADGEPLTVVVSDGGGTLTAAPAGDVSITGENSHELTLTGDLADLNTTLASLSYLTSQATGSDTISLSVTDVHHATASEQIAVNTLPVPFTAPVLVSPVQELYIPGTATGVGGLKVVDPFAEATNSPVSVSFQGASPDTQLTVTGNSGATITGEGTSKVTITGTVQEVNADLADGLIEFVIGTLGNFDSSGISGIISATDPEGLVSAAGGPEGKFFQIGVAAASYAIEGLLSLIPGNPPVSAAAFYAELAKILAGFPHVVTLDGLAYDLEGAGEYFLTGSTESSDSFTVEVRLQPYGNSQSVSVMTAVAALLGTDRVTFQINRPNTVWVDGAAENISVGETISLTGGQLTEISSGTYQIAWNTGEMLGVTDHGSYLDVGVGLGSGDAPGTLAGLMGPDNGQANDFTLPDGTVLAQPLTAAALAEFTNAWRVTQATSLFDYSPGQSTATFTDVGFPEDAVKLADLPADVVAKAAVVVAAAGITDPVAVADAEFDYIASGGDVNVVTADAAEFQGVASTAAAVSPPVGPAVAVLGVIADEPQVITPANGPTEVTFDVYLTAAEATGTVVDYSVIAPDAGDLAGAAFGGSPPTGEITILAGDTTGQFTVAVPEGALGTNPNQTLEVAISAPGGTPIFVSTAQATVVQPLPGPVPLPQLSDLTTLGTFAGSGSRYSLDLGAIQAGEPLPVLQFMISNAAGTGADDLAGSFSVDPVEGFTVAGASPLSPLAPGQSYRGLEVSVDEMKFGANSETITFTPEDVNASGYSAALSPPITLDVSYTLEQQTMVYSQAWGDVHIVTYNGLSYNFQAVGEFTLAKSRLPGDSFDIEMRLQPYYSGASVSVITAVAVSVGSDRVTFSMGRADTVWIDGTPSTIDVANPTVSLDGGLLQEVSPSVWQVSWNTGETATITKVGDSLFNIVDGVPVSEPGFVGGLQGEDEGSTNDFQLADGTVLPQPLSPATLYGEYANSWRVSPATTLFDYGPGQSTTTYTDVNFPTDLVNLSELPATAVAAAAALVAAAGITDPGIAAQAEYDYLATGNVDFITAAADANAQGTTTTPVVMVSPPPPPPTLGIAAEKVSIVETPDGATAVTFDIYLTGAETSATTVAYTVIDGGAGYLGAAELGGPLPSGTATIAAGATSTTVTIDVPDGALGNQPNADLELQISSPAGGPSVFAPNATTEIIHSPPVAGTPPAPALVELAGGGIFSFDAATSTYTIDLGTIPEGAVAPLIQLGIANNAAVPADELSGNFTVPLGSGFLVTGADLPHAIAAAQMYGGLYLSANTATPGSYTETFSFDPKDVNDSGYIAALPGDDFTIVVTDTVGAAAQATLNTPDMILFPNVRRGTPESETISVSNSTPTGSADLDVTPAAGGDTYANGSVALLAAGATDATSISIGLDTASIGPLSGTVTLALQSDSGGGVTEPILPSPTIQVFGSVFDEASALIAPVSEIVHVHDADTAALGVANADTIKYFSENLIASLAGTTGGISIVSGGPTGEIAEGSADDTSLTIGFSTATAGVDSGNVTVALISDGGTGAGSIDGLGQIALPSQVVPISVTVDNYAAAGLSETNGVGTFTAAGTNGEGGANYTLDLGTVALGASPVVIDLDALNTAAGQADLLAGLFSETGDGAFVNALGPFSGLGAGDATEAGTVTLDTDGAGTFSETITLIGTGSNASGYSGTVSPATLTIEGTVAASPPPPPPPPPPASPPPSITAPVSVTVQAGEASAVAGIAIADAAIGTGGVTVTLSDGHGALAASGAGGATIGGSGGIALTISGTLSEVNAALATLTDTDANSTPDTITIGVSDADGSAGPATTLVGHVFTLTKSADTVAGGPGNDLILAAAGTPSAGDAIDGGGGSDTLELVGAGVFNLATPTTIVNIQNIVLQEGQAAYAINGNTYVAQNQIVNLRSGLNDVTVTVLADTTYNPANPNVAVITVVANSNNDTIDLPSGEDPAVATSIATLTVGSAQQTVNLGGGNNVIMVNAATINATIGNGTGSDKLQVTGGGTMAMGSNISDIATVQLSAASSPYDFTANGIAGLTITDASTTLDTVQAGGADQAITGGGAGKLTMLGAAAGGDTFKNTAALFNNDTIGGFAAPGDIIDLTDLVYGAGAIRSFAENSAGTSAMLVVSDGSHTADLTLLGQFANAFVAAPDAAGTGTQITYQPTQEELALLAHH